MRYVSFLRAINVGGHVVPMSELKTIFESLGLENVETFIASGNVIFTARSGKPDALEAKIERGLLARLGYEVTTFLRTEAEILAVTEAEPFARPEIEAAAAFNVAFTKTPLSAAQAGQLTAFDTGIDTFRASGREIYWLCRMKQSESKFVSAKMERLLGIRVTWRNMNTVRRLSAKYPSAVVKSTRKQGKR